QAVRDFAAGQGDGHLEDLGEPVHLATLGAGARRLEVGGVTCPGGDQMRADVLVVPAGAEQVGQQPVRPFRAADDPADHRRHRLVFRSGPATAIAASSSSSTFCQTLTAMYSITGRTCLVECIVATAWLSRTPTRRTFSVASTRRSSSS